MASIDGASVFKAIARKAADHFEEGFDLIGHQPLSGGCINRAVRLQGSSMDLFVKYNRADLVSMFEAEAEGLRAIGTVDALRTPNLVCWGCLDQTAYLVLEYIEIGAAASKTMAALGRGLAGLHARSAPTFGWSRDNWIGSIAQSNAPTDVWVDFWRDQRLAPQLRLSTTRGLPNDIEALGHRLLDCLGEFFRGYEPEPALLHGDLWGGNVGSSPSGEPVVFDPAVYFGDREADLAMTELFGGFDRAFYESYNATWRLDSGYKVRRNLYNLYHVLNHYNMFGGGYGVQAAEMIRRLLAELS